MFHAVVRPFLAALSTLFLLVTGCGGVENEPNLAKAVERTEATGSSRIEVRAALVENGRTLAFRCDGTADYGRQRLRLGCNYGIGEMIVIGDAQYFTSDAFGVRIDERWVKVPLDESDSLNQFSPERLLGLLRDASLETTRLGEETVRQVATVRYQLTVNCERAQIGCSGTTAPVYVWIDDDGLVRRIELEDDGTPGTIEFFDFGVQVDIEPPPTDQVAEVGEGSTGYGPSQDPNAAPCSEREATPISESRALEALHRHGFSVRTDRSGYCLAGVAAVMTNAHREDALEREGVLHCFLRDKPEEGAPTRVVRRGVDGGDAELLLANLACMILADSPRAEEKIRPLEEAFAELQRTIRP
jgi:hypothetical protein